MLEAIIGFGALTALIAGFFVVDWLLDRRLRRRVAGGGQHGVDDPHGRNSRVNRAHVQSQGQSHTNATWFG